MKKSQIIINIILLLAIAGLYVINFTSTGDAKNEQTAAKGTSKKVDEATIAYVNIDTLLNNYDYYFEMQQDLGEKQKSSQAELQSRSQSYQKSLQDFQYKVQKGLVTRSTAEQMQRELMKEEQELMKLREQLSMQLAEEEQVMNRVLINEIMEFLEGYNADGRYDYIFSTSFGSNILYADDSLNITNEVLNGLNQNYTESKGEK
jgi:outer membrane protein